jgi:predicted ATPase/Tfp pilus assembly protein PilF
VSLPTGTVTFLFTDIEGSTRLLHELGDAYVEALAEHRRVLREAFGRYGGVEVDTQGDAFFVAFARASDALSAASAAQSALAGPIRVRMGLHTGEPVITDEGYVGIEVHRAARIAAAGHGGQVLMSQSTHDLVAADALKDLGEHRLKDLTAPERIYQLGDGEFPPLQSLNQTNLPVQPTPLVGRKDELDEILALFRRDDVRLLTLTGPGGAGKTRLALQAAAELVEDYPGGAWFVPLASVTDVEFVLPTIATTLGVKDGLGDQLPERKTLLVLDNLEHLVEAGPRLAELLAAAPQVAILATSRERLALAAEYEYVVPTLSVADAVALFVARARQLDPRFEPGDRVAEICRRLDRLPLALELAAARVKVLTAGQILSRLERRLDLLGTGTRDLPERQRTLRNTIAWSYGLLDEMERSLFARLAVFPGSFDLEAAEDVAAADLDTLQSLVDKSLLRRTRAGRFFMLETISDYAVEQLEQTGVGDSIRLRHVEHFLALAERAAVELRGPNQTVWLSRLDAEHDNFRSALTWLGGADEAELELRLSIALTRFWYVRGHVSEARSWLEKVLAANLVLAVSAEQPAPLRAQVVTSAAAFALIQGDYPEATRLSEESLQLARGQADPGRIANALSNLGAVVLASGDTTRARPLLEEAAALSRELDEKPVVARAINNLGDFALTAGEYARAETLFRESLVLLRELGDTSNVARSLFNLGAAALQLGRHAEALSRFRESIALSREMEDKEDLAWCLEGFAALAVAEGNPERAARLLGAAEGLLDAMAGEFKPFERLLHEGTVAATRSQLTRRSFDVARAEGESLGLSEAVEYALETSH